MLTMVDAITVAPPKVAIQLKVNGTARKGEVEPRLLLVHYLRDHLGLTGTHVGCDTSQCGTCVVELNGKAIKSCTVLAVQADGAEVTTIEGLADGDTYHPVQQGFWEMHGLQCGFCTPGMIMATVGLLKRNPNPSEDEIRHALEGNLCRCTGYQNIVKAVQYAAGQMNGAQAADAPLPMEVSGDQLPPTGEPSHDPQTVQEWGGQVAGESDDPAT